MLNLSKGFHINADDRSYVVLEDVMTGKGEINLIPRGYYVKLEHAVDAVLKFQTRNLIIEEQLDLKEFLEKYKLLVEGLVLSINRAEVEETKKLREKKQSKVRNYGRD